MPDSVEENLQRVLKGLPLDADEAEICDFTLEEQNEALESQGIQPSVDPKYKPILCETVMYIVACVILNEHDEVLMMQEAKKSCSGKWYLPAGHMEKGENITTACEREVLEETGMKIECTTLLMVETARGNWMRFVLTGKVVGGNLKTPAEADKESLQAKWVKNVNELDLRASDITHLIDRARVYYAAKKSSEPGWIQDQLPALRAYSKQLLRLVVIIKKKATNRVHILLSERTSWHLPVCEIHPTKSLHSTLRRFMVELFGAEVPAHRPYGLLSVEYDPSTDKDGLCLTLLVAFRSPLEEVPIIGKCVWHETTKDLGDHLLQRVASRNASFPLHVIR
ncbi:8-oxo-dGDP phosphatase NUDT18 [Leptinotarsa decemlineata]|uniref:8-oxo-dGDP phosphatase NUDT18 n=1 Tax=Leptinotarsa decemlineata TaxID=7539 RepID=UPI003D30B5CB